jgi:hypothetical protein
LGLEQRVKDYLAERHKILSLSGPTKSGKTVLLRSILGDREVIWLSGGELDNLDAVWAAIADHLGLFPDETLTGEQVAISETERSGSVSVRPAGVGIQGDVVERAGERSARGGAQARSRPMLPAVKQALLARTPVLVIDDFHYLDRDLQLAVVRGLKDLVFEGLPVILAAVPHRAYDAVRVEREMTGRVEQLPITFWTEDELLGIPSAGFAALKIIDQAGLARHLAGESFSSPYLMQDFCLQLCKANGVTERQDQAVRLEPPDWEAFFRLRASAASKTAFDFLARGPRQRSDRLERVLKDGRTMDIYGVVLAAIAHTGPLTKLTYEELRAALRDILAEPPQRHEVTRVLEEMSKIAREQIEGEPVVDYDEELATLFISDPFFAYYLRWGAT